ncbi:hypothetical protein CTI12_AA260040 [Artemisia annua]|uniref:Uncharacterized protein n=1 Tax=Artemisia annua TaxID=35608 RepID=A0A2U1NJE8_ARTAN|nr:hypothetical protein CTI12_AA260040 [Artemisia annua]
MGRQARKVHERLKWYKVMMDKEWVIKKLFSLSVSPRHNKEPYYMQNFPRELGEKIFPPVFKRPIGRPRKNRIVAHDESKRKKRCPRCHKTGHHEKSCKNPAPSKDFEESEASAMIEKGVLLNKRKHSGSIGAGNACGEMFGFSQDFVIEVLVQETHVCFIDLSYVLVFNINLNNMKQLVIGYSFSNNLARTNAFCSATKRQDGTIQQCCARNVFDEMSIRIITRIVSIVTLDSNCSSSFTDVENALKKNFKSYGAWHHRKWAVSKGNTSTVKFLLSDNHKGEQDGTMVDEGSYSTQPWLSYLCMRISRFLLCPLRECGVTGISLSGDHGS